MWQQGTQHKKPHPRRRASVRAAARAKAELCGRAEAAEINRKIINAFTTSDAENNVPPPTPPTQQPPPFTNNEDTDDNKQYTGARTRLRPC